MDPLASFIVWIGGVGLGFALGLLSSRRQVRSMSRQIQDMGYAMSNLARDGFVPVTPPSPAPATRDPVVEEPMPTALTAFLNGLEAQNRELAEDYINSRVASGADYEQILNELRKGA